MIVSIGIFLTSVSYWFQIYKIHQHKEVRDLSKMAFSGLLLGYVCLFYGAWTEDSAIFMFKQIATGIPVAIILGQIIYHKGDHWVDASDPDCPQCGEDSEPDFSCCPYCELPVRDWDTWRAQNEKEEEA